MNPILKNSLALILGLVVGSFVNMGLILLGDVIISLPAGVDQSSYESFKESIHLFEPKHYLVPFLAHALGTLVGAVVAAMMAVSHKRRFALAIGVLFLAGGISNVVILPSPLWFNVVDLVFTYIPMAFLGYKLYLKYSTSSQTR